MLSVVVCLLLFEFIGCVGIGCLLVVVRMLTAVVVAWLLVARWSSCGSFEFFIMITKCRLTYVHHTVWKPERCLRVFMSRPEEIGSTGHRPGRPDSQDLFVGLG
jgi:hypothetical protein